MTRYKIRDPFNTDFDPSGVYVIEEILERFQPIEEPQENVCPNVNSEKSNVIQEIEKLEEVPDLHPQSAEMIEKDIYSALQIMNKNLITLINSMRKGGR
jgi:hypothetical protein